ncbi:MAG TPA: tripartite tricarboxylate transporter TctB family protein [Aestuariivirgaceae bacterium]|jgi:putative tricarboxylic transport membrane protein|nr:tripartite tricarboxylate transporter TctB family protein [Aestuariivirgaceae bacterium]
MERLNLRDAAAGAVFLVIGTAFALGAFHLEIGSAFRMGPGYFPLLLSIVLMLLGAIIIANSFAAASEPLGPVPWRGLALVLAAPVVFGLTVRKLGLVPAIILTVVLAVYASQRSRLWLAGLLSIGLTVFCLAVFTYGLRLPLPLIGPWLRF